MHISEEIKNSFKGLDCVVKYTNKPADEEIEVGLVPQPGDITAEEFAREKGLPLEIKGVKITYEFEAINFNNTADEFDPLIGGISIGDATGVTGTLGGIVWDKENNERYMLSNAHIFASDTPEQGQDILQPGGGSLAGKLTKWQDITKNSDAALASLEREAKNYTYHNIGDVPNVGILKQNRLNSNTEIAKYGKTSGFTVNTIKNPYVNIYINGNLISNVIETKNRFSESGDSGSRVWDRSTGKVIGIVFAASSHHTYIIPADRIEQTLEVWFQNPEDIPTTTDGEDVPEQYDENSFDVPEQFNEDIELQNDLECGGGCTCDTDCTCECDSEWSGDCGCDGDCTCECDSEWSGDCGCDGDCTCECDSEWSGNCSCECDAEPPTEYTLTTSTNGSGSVNPSGSNNYEEGTTVNLSATSSTGWEFSHWNGSVADTNSSSTTITINSNESVTAVFTLKEYNLTVNTTGEGSTTPSGTNVYEHGDVVSLSATPNTGWEFSHWSGSVSDSTNANTDILMEGNETVTAVFERSEYTLTITKEGNGAISPAVGTISVTYEDTVNLSATPNTGWEFSHWDGYVESASASESFVMPASNIELRGTFTRFFGLEHAIDRQSNYIRVGWYAENASNFEKFEVYKGGTLLETITNFSTQHYKDENLNPETDHEYSIIYYYDGGNKESTIVSTSTTRPGHAVYASTEITTSTGTIDFSLEHLFSNPYVENIYIDFEVLNSSSATINGTSYSSFPAEINNYPTVDITDGDLENPVLILEYYEAGWGIKGTNLDGEYKLLLNTAGEREIYDTFESEEGTSTMGEALLTTGAERFEDHFFQYEIITSHAVEGDEVFLQTGFYDEDGDEYRFPGEFEDREFQISLDESLWEHQLSLTNPTLGEGIFIYSKTNLNYGNYTLLIGNLSENVNGYLKIERPPDVEGTITVRKSNLTELDSTISVAGSEEDDLDGTVEIRRSNTSRINSRIIVSSGEDDEIIGTIRPRFNEVSELPSTLKKRKSTRNNLTGRMEIHSNLFYSRDILGKITVGDREFDLGEYWPREKWDIGLITLKDLDEGKRNEFGAVNQVRDLHGFPFKRLTGILKLIYYFKKLALTTYGSDPNNGEYGCYLKKMIGQSYNDLSEVAEELEREIQRVKDQIIEFQNEYGFHIPKEEKLRDLRLLRIYEDHELDFWSVNSEYKIITEAGEEYEGELFSN